MSDGSEVELAQVEPLFFPYATKRRKRVVDEGIRFVHYTSAEAGIAIIRSRMIRLRNSSVMNDFSEVQYGIECLTSAIYNGVTGARFQKALNDIDQSLVDVIENAINSLAEHQINSSYLVSIGEHGDKVIDEDQYGRLSMWRAYGGNVNIAFVFNNRPFTTPSDALGAYTSPILYADFDEFGREFEDFVINIERNMVAIKRLPLDQIVSALVSAMHFAILSTKHPGFAEEKEWRVIHSPTLWPSTVIQKSVEVIGGIPQHIYSIPMRNIPDQGFVGAEIPELIDRVIIGPTQYPGPISRAFVDELEKAGVADASSRVVVSNIPLRR